MESSPFGVPGSLHGALSLTMRIPAPAVLINIEEEVTQEKKKEKKTKTKKWPRLYKQDKVIYFLAYL